MNEPDKNEELRINDICAHYAEDYTTHYGAMSPPIYQTSLFLEGNEYNYSRVGNPTLDVFERKAAALEHGEKAVLTSAGTAAISTALLASLKAGDHMVMVRTAYGGARACAGYLEKFGISHTFIPGTDISQFEAAMRPETTVFYLESPGSGIFEMQDLAAVAELAKSRGITTIIDNTCATSLYQQPLDYGIDLVVHSATKYYGGHSDVVAGLIVGNGEKINTIAGRERSILGNPPPPIQAWLLQRSIRTLPVRLKQHGENAMQVARFLESHPLVERVLYTGLESFPQRSLYLKQMKGSGGLMSFKPKGDRCKTPDFVKRLSTFHFAPSWGGYESLVYPLGMDLPEDHPVNDSFGGGVIRLFIGLEDTQTLMEDLDRALEAFR